MKISIEKIKLSEKEIALSKQIQKKQKKVSEVNSTNDYI
jgi:hypothetical protein